VPGKTHFKVQNTKWLWIVNDTVTTVNSDKVLCGSFGLYPSYVAGILNSVKEIHFCVLCSEKLNYADYVEKYIAGKECTFKFHTSCDFKVVTEYRFQLTFGGETVTISIEARQFPKLPSEPIFAQSVLKKIQLTSLACGIVGVNKCVTYITNKVLTSKHDCVYERYTYDLDLTKKLAGCTLYTQYRSM
jgi:hypothetical protein